MRKLKKGLALFLAIALIGTLLPETAFALQGKEGEEIRQEAGFAGETPAEEAAEQSIAEESAGKIAVEGTEAKEAGETSAADPLGQSPTAEAPQTFVTSTESFRVLTEGQELHHTGAAQEFYRFQPEESGWYRLVMQSRTDCKFSAGVQQAIYYEGNVEKKRDFTREARYRLYQNTQLSQLMWLNQEEIYEFYCMVSSYEDPDSLDVALVMKRGEVASMETAAPPSATSNNAWIGTGMQVRLQYTDGESSVSDVDCSYSSYSEDSGYSTNTLRALAWSDIAHQKEASISREIQILSLDGDTENLNIYQLAEGEHTAGLGIRYTSSGTPSYFEFQTKFQAAHNPVKSIAVTQKRDSYTRKFGQHLEAITIEAVHEDGKKDTVYSGNSSVYQYLRGEDIEGPGGEMYPMQYTDIDSYMDALERSGKLGEGGVTKADVTVEYQGVQAAYPITIAENPYNGISVTPNRTVYYLDAGDSISVSDVGKVTLSRKDGAKADVYAQMTSIPGNTYYNYGNFGLKLEGKDSFYKEMKGYQNAGGTSGKKQVTVTYLDYQTEFAVELRENPYERIEIVQDPQKTEYKYSRYSQSLESEGLVFRAYKADGTYDDYAYGSKEGAVEGWQRYFRVTPDSSWWYSAVGEHSVTVSFMGHTAAFQIQVVEEQQPEKPVYTGLKILKAPTRTIYYVGEKDTAEYGSVLTEEGLEFELTDSKGVTKKYRYGLYEEKDGYSSWQDIWWEVDVVWGEIDWTKPGTYQAWLTCQDLEEEFEIMLADSPVVSFDILSMPDKGVYYRYEGGGMDLKGMSYRIVFDDGSIHAETLRSANASMKFQYQGRNYQVKREWVKANSSGSPTYGENGVKFTLFGKEYRTGAISVFQDPVDSVAFVKAPAEKVCAMNGRMDLYGAEILISYTDGTKQTVKVTEHVSSLKVEDAYRQTLSAQVVFQGDPMAGNSQKYIHVTYMNASAEIPAGLDPSKEKSMAIADGSQTGVIDLGEGQAYQILSFTPKETKPYYFYCIDVEENAYTPVQAELYEGSHYVYPMSGSGWSTPMTLWEMKAGTTYYLVLSRESQSYSGRNMFQCYLSSSVSSQAEVGEIKKVTANTENVKKVWYDFEFQNSYIGYLEGLDLSCEITYDNPHQWREVRYPSMASLTVGGRLVSADWKYRRSETNWEDWGKPQIRDDNAIQIKWGDELLAEVPVRLEVPSPVESLTIGSNPLEGCYQYQQGKSLKGLSVTIHYTKADGRPDKAVVWEGDIAWQMVDGYELQVSRNVYGQAGEDGAACELQADYMGASVKEKVTLLPNPITGFELKKKPVKDSYYHFEDSGNPDLYGMEFAVIYRDGHQETYQVKEHGSKVQLSGGSGEQVTADIRTKEETRFLYLDGRGFRQEVMEYTPLSLEDAETEDIQEGQAKYSVIGKDALYKIYRLVAAADSEYTFRAKSRIDQTVYLYDGAGKRLHSMYASAGQQGELKWSFRKGETAYYVVLARDTERIGSVGCTLAGKEIQKADIPSVRLEAEDPVAGQELPQVFTQIQDEGYGIESSQWFGGEDGSAAFATAHRLKVILNPDVSHRFTADTKVTVNGTEADFTLEANGTISLYVAFPYTECRVELPEVDGDSLDIRNEKKDRVSYGGSFSFRYVDETGAPDRGLVVKANGNPVPLGEDGYYTLENVTENIKVIARPDYGEAGEGESLLALYNGSRDLYHTMIGKKNRTIHDNKEENTLPLLPSYAEGSDQFFYGWYLGKDAGWNGIGTRFTSRTKLLEEAYRLYAKWGSGYFTSTANGRQVQYKVMSFDEFNKMKVQVNGLARRQERMAADAQGSLFDKAGEESASQGSLLAGAREKGAFQENLLLAGAGEKSASQGSLFAGAEEEEGMLEIPASVEQDQMAMEEGLEIQVAGCRVASVAESAFAGDASLKNIILPDTVEEIGANAFADCTGLEGVQLPEGISGIADGTFAGCTSLQEITMPGNVRELGSDAFAGCTSLQGVTIPQGVRKMGENAFSGCSALEEITIPDGVEEIGEGTFAECVSLKKVTLPKSITRIEENAFAGCGALEELTIPEGIEELGEGAFAGCTSLQEITIPKGMAEIGANAFAGCTSLKKAEIPDSVTELPAGVFRDCGNLTVILPDTIEKIDAGAFAGTEQVSLICSSELAGSQAIQEIQNAGLPVRAVSFSLEGDGVLSYGEPGRITADFRINGETVEDRKLVWEYTDTDAFAFQREGNSLILVPRRRTAANEKISVTVTDPELQLESSLQLRTIAADLGRSGKDGNPLYEIELEKADYVYSGTQYRPRAVVRKAADAALLDAGDYTVAYSNNQKAGTAQVVVTGKGNYRGVVRKTFVIAKAEQHITASDLVWSVKEPLVKLNASSSGDGKLSYASSNEKVASVDDSGIAIIHAAGTAVIRIQAAESDNYKASKVKEITLTVRPSPSADTKPSKLKVPKTSYKVALGSKPFALKATARTAIRYKSSSPKVAAVSKAGKVTPKKCGKAVITIETRDARKKATVYITPRKAAIRQLQSPQAGQLKVSWTRQKEASGYVLECSTDKNFKKNVTRKTIRRNQTTNAAFKKLSRGRKYYVRIKAYITIGGKKIDAPVSRAAARKVKK